MSEQDSSPSESSSKKNLVFSGQALEYFKIWIVNIILSILTLGIYSAWAKVRNNRYFYGNTQLDNAAFEYHATPIMILKGRLIAIAALIIYITLSNFYPLAAIVFAVILTLVSPWLIWKSLQFNARMMSYRNVRFSFKGTLKEAYTILLLIPFIPLILTGIVFLLLYLISGELSLEVILAILPITFLATYLLFPYIQQLFTSYYINHQKYGQGNFFTQLSSKKYYKTYLFMILWVSLLIMATSAILTIIMAIFTGIDAYTNIQSLGSYDEQMSPAVIEGVIATMIFMVIPIYLAFIFVGLWAKAYLETHIRAYVFHHTQLDQVLRLKSNLAIGKLFIIYATNTLAIIFTMGLAYPWAIIRLTRYKIESIDAIVTGDLSNYVNQQQEKQSALGDEVGNAFDLDLDLGM
jgi:uncharacterized membrane protein YjgN (DUF898 family)